LGHKTLMMKADATAHGAVQSPAEGRVYAEWLRENRGKFHGVICSLPNFGDETGAVAALKDAGVPILIQAYPDEVGKMDPKQRRDSFCGKLSVMDVFCQYGVPFTALKPHTVAPGSPRFAENVDYFDRVCRVVAGMKDMVVGAIGARTTAFKTVRIDELALQANGITMETFDLSDIFDRLEKLKTTSQAYKAKARVLKGYSDWSAVPNTALDKLVRLGVVLDNLIEEAGLEALALRCWLEMQTHLGVSPCVVLSEINNRGMAGACEVDVGNAVTMHALTCASGEVPTCLDWNNNWGEEDDKCVLFHCGVSPQAMMTNKGRVTDHGILINSVGEGIGYGCNVGRLKPAEFTFGSMATQKGELNFYLGEGCFTEDQLPAEFFGCGGVAEIPHLQDVLLHVGLNGHRHHTSVTPTKVAAPVAHALTRYCGYNVAMPQKGVS